MTTTAQFFSRMAMASVFTMAMSVGVSAGNEPTTSMWMAASSAEPGVSTNWGRLVLKEGVLAFHSRNLEWALEISDISRVSIYEQSDRLLVVESVAGETYYVAILAQNLLVESPREAMQVIQRVARTPAARRER